MVTSKVRNTDQTKFKIEIPTPQIPTPQIIGIIDPETPGSGTVTPVEERAPRFSHECLTPPNGDVRPASREHDEYEGKGPRDPFENSAIDLDDPSIEEFPLEREAIFEQVLSCQRRLSEDPTAVEGVPPSPVVGHNGHPERFDLPAVSPNVLTRNDQRSPSLLSIQEEDGDDFHKEELWALPRSITQPKSEPDLKEATAKDEREKSVEVHEISAESPPVGIIESAAHNYSERQVDGPHISPGPVELPETPFGADENKQLDSEDGSPQEIVSPKEGPSITVLPSTPGTSMKNRGSDPFDKPIDGAKTTAIEEENGRAHLTSRKARAPSPTPDRPITPSSMRSAGKDAKSKNFLKTFLHLVFVEWIGGLIARLCGGRRNV
jgi:hypothetical protein